MKTFELKPEAYRPGPPAKKDYGIGIIGCGSIVIGAHMPAYRACGYRVVACCDLRQEAVDTMRNRYGVAKGGTDINIVLDDPDVQIVDLAVHAKQRLPLVEKIAAAGKHIFSQKPFAMDFADASKMVNICRQAGVTLMVNQQARWAPAHKAAKLVIDSGVLGHVYSVMHVMRSFQDVANSWFTALENFNIVDHGIHYIDLSRYFTGRTPVRVKCTTTPVPGQNAASPMIYTINCEYEPDAQVMSTLHFNNIVQTQAMHGYFWHIDGTEGSLTVTHQELTLSFKDEPRHKQVFRIEGAWFPDAFGGAMGEMMLALSENREPQTSGRDNLESLKIAYAAVKSSQEGRAVELSEIR